MPLNFGIPSLDRLLEIPNVKDPLDFDESSMAILGPDGSGKSVLALHLASTYLADCRRFLLDPEFRRENEPAKFLPLVLYISSDLRHSSAQRVWKNFALEAPSTRQVPFEQIWESMVRAGLSFSLPPGTVWNATLRLKCYKPGKLSASEPKPEEIAHFLQTQTLLSTDEAQVAFLDLASKTAGDDWSFANSLIGQLESVETPRIQNSKKDKVRNLKHLVIIDSVAGFETFVGKLDAHGEEQSRRARIAQCMRNAGSHCHVVFVVEEPKDEERLPEEYVTDVVIRLRTVNGSTRSERTVEIEKARARQHAVGQHPFEVRGPQGTSTGEWENPDTPIAKNGYVQVFPTLNHRYLVAAMASGPGKLDPSTFVAPFGLRYLDQLLAQGPRMDELNSAKFSNGLRCGSVTAILGDSSTGKSVLSEKLLAEGFLRLAQDWIGLYAGATDEKTHAKPAFQNALSNTLANLSTPIIEEVSESKETGVSSAKIGVFDAAQAIGHLHKAAKDGLLKSEANLQSIIEKHKDNPLLGHHPGDDLPADWRDQFASRTNRTKIIEMHRPERKPQPATNARHHSLLANLTATWHTTWNRPLGKFSPEEAIALLDGLFAHPNLRFPGVLLTTSDKKASDVALRCLRYLDSAIESAIEGLWGKNAPKGLRDRIVTNLTRVIEDQLIVRRLDIDTVSTAAFVHLIQRNIYAAQEMIFGALFPPRQIDRNRKSNRIQLVVDDFRVLCSMCSAMQRDSLFLPYLAFALQREGVTSVIVYTDAVRPDRRPDDETSRTLLSLVNLGIFLWSVPFEGRSRIALTVVPPSSDANNGIIRELTLSEYGGELKKSPNPRTVIPNVTPHFELYSGIEEGKPKLIPLAVYLFDEAHRFSEYVDKEDALYRELFAAYDDPHAPGHGRILFPLDAKRYEALRDFAHLPSDTQDGHTIVYQVDGYWSMTGDGSLNSVYDYLFSDLEPDERLIKHQDPYRLFRNSPLSNSGSQTQPARRIHFFQNKFYRSRLLEYGDYNPRAGESEPPKPDRVPFMWDFAFTLARTGPWTLAEKTILSCSLALNPGQAVSVRDVFELLSSADQPRKPAWFNSYGWRYFFEACQIVADQYRVKTGTPVLPFDLATPSGETLNCLVLEIWLSELDSLLGAKRRWAQDWTDKRKLLSNPDYDPAGQFRIRELMSIGLDGRSVAEAINDVKPNSNEPEPIGILALYKTWLLLLEVLDFTQFCSSADGFNVVDSRDCSLNAVASRHWYKTACDFSARIQSEQGVHDGVSLLRLPGKFSTRGDWFLASSEGSRSRLLGQHAIDLLSSRRANLTRMQMGLGLPVRDVLHPEGTPRLRTALQCEVKGVLSQVPYEDLVERCGIVPGSFRDDFFWLWRSSFTDYDRQSRVLQKWLARIFQWTIRYRREHPKKWEGGFLAYDQMSQGNFERFQTYSSSAEFAEHCDLLLDELRAAERAAD